MNGFKFLFSAILFTALILTGCNKHNNPIGPNDTGTSTNSISITGTIQNWNLGSHYKILLEVEKDTNRFVAGESSIGSDGSFDIKKEKDVPSEYLSPSEFTGISGLNVSNPDANSAEANFYIADSNNSELLLVIYIGGNDSTLFRKSYEYLDSDLKVTGSLEDDFNYQVSVNLNLKKGWNVIYSINHTNTKKFIMTTEEPQLNGVWEIYD